MYPFPIRWDLMTEEVLRELRVLKELKTDLGMAAPKAVGKKSWLVMLFRGKLSFEALFETKFLSSF